MVAQTIDLPNIRKFFVPDPGHTLVECDLNRAESQIVAWESGDPDLKDIFHSGVDIHTENAKIVYPPPIDYFKRDRLKRCIYAIQNGGRPAKIGELLNSPALGDKFYNYWTGRFPAIQQWHTKLLNEVAATRMLRNIWGFRAPYLDRVTKESVGELVPWITQSTIGITINKGFVLVRRVPDVRVLIQVHDSLLMQVPTCILAARLRLIREALEVAIPYTDPLIIPIEIKISTRSWGEMEKIS